MNGFSMYKLTDRAEFLADSTLQVVFGILPTIFQTSSLFCSQIGELISVTPKSEVERKRE